MIRKAYLFFIRQVDAYKFCQADNINTLSDSVGSGSDWSVFLFGALSYPIKNCFLILPINEGYPIVFLLMTATGHENVWAKRMSDAPCVVHLIIV